MAATTQKACESSRSYKSNRSQSTRSQKARRKKKSLSKELEPPPRKFEQYIRPMLAREADTAFSDKDWIYEIKWDGYRAIAELDGSNVLLYSRNGINFSVNYPIVTEALRRMKLQAVLDGEIVVLSDNGDPSFQLLQHYESDGDHPIVYYVFDVLSIKGKSTCGLTLLERKKLLEKLLKESEVVRYSDHIEERGEAFFEVARERSLEGIMAKRADSEYYPGTRTNNWLKIKHHHSQEAIIAGFTEPTGSRKHFGALVLGFKDGKNLKYAGHTGSGFTQASLRDMYGLLKPLIQQESPFKERVKTNRPVTWVKPVLVCEIKYSEMTNDGLMRHPIFLRLRDDKKASEVTMKASKKVSAKAAKKTAPGKKAAPGKKEAAKKVPAKKPVAKVAAKKTDKRSAATAKTVKTVKANRVVDAMSFGKIKVPVTNLGKVFWPKEKITKGDVINYYQSVAGYILPYLKGRPESLYRTPNGVGKPGFFHKDAGDEAPGWVESIALYSESANKDIDYILCNNKPTLAYLNNLGCIEINPWHSTVKALDNPDYLIIDLDPSEKNTFEQVIETAQAVKQVLDKAGAASFCKTSGATGLHIYIPVQKKYTYDQVKDFAQLICILTNELLPGFTSMERNLKKRGNNKIYLDHLQNRRGQTIACAYSLRPKEGATVSMPLHWKEVKKGLTPKDFNIYTALKRIEKEGDLFKSILGKGIDLARCLENLE